MSAPGVGEFAALGTALCWTVSVVSFAAASRRVGSLSVNLIRLVIAWLLLALTGWLMRGHFWPSDASAHVWGWLMLSGFVGFFIGDLCLMRAFIVIGPRLAALSMTLAPPIAALMGLAILGQQLSPLNWLGIGVTLAGVVWVVLEQRPIGENQARRISAWGVTLGVLAAAGQAAGLIFSKIGMDAGPAGAPPYDAFAATQIRAFAGIIGFVVLLGALRWHVRLWDALRHPSAMAYTSIGAIAGPFLGVSLLLFAVQRIPAGIAQALVAPVPVLVIPFVIVLHKERVSLRALIGACIAVAGVVLLLLTSSR